MRSSLKLSVLLSLSMLAACGGDSSNSNSQGVQGLWSGTFDTVGFFAPPDVSYNVVGGIGAGGEALFFDSKGDVFTLSPVVNSSGAYTGTVYGYTAFNPTTPAQSTAQLSHLSGTVRPTTIQISAFGIDKGGTLNVTPYAAYSGTPSFSAGVWQGYYLGTASSLSLSVDAAGRINGADASGCTVTGVITQVKPNQNLYEVTYLAAAASGPVAGACGGAFAGLGFISSSDMSGKLGSGTFFYVVLTGSSEVYVLEFKMP